MIEKYIWFAKKYKALREQKKVFRGMTVWAGWVQRVWWTWSIASFSSPKFFWYFWKQKYKEENLSDFRFHLESSQSSDLARSP